MKKRNDQAARYAIFFGVLFDAVLDMLPADCQSPAALRQRFDIGEPQRAEFYGVVVRKARDMLKEVRVICNTRTLAN